MPVPQKRSRTEGLEAQQWRSVFSAEIVFLGQKFKNVCGAWTAEKREQVPQVVQVDTVDEDVRIPLLQSGYTFRVGSDKTKVGAGGSGIVRQRHLLPQHLLTACSRDGNGVNGIVKLRQ